MRESGLLLLLLDVGERLIVGFGRGRGADDDGFGARGELGAAARGFGVGCGGGGHACDVVVVFVIVAVCAAVVVAAAEALEGCARGDRAELFAGERAAATVAVRADAAWAGGIVGRGVTAAGVVSRGDPVNDNGAEEDWRWGQC